MIVQCCVCHKVRNEEKTWVAPSQSFEGQDISHGYCPVCAAEAFAEIRRWVEGNKQANVSVA
jgi:hypothetical protein